MKKITFKKVSAAHAEILQSELLTYSEGFNEHLKHPEDNTVYLYSIAQVDIAMQLWFFLRPKVESAKKEVTFSLSLSQAVCLFNACSNASVCSEDVYVINTCHKYIDFIDAELKSLIVYEEKKETGQKNNPEVLSA